MNQLTSIVIPCYNEEGNLTPLMESISQVCNGIPYEIIVVDDGSTDGTVDELRHISSTLQNLRIVSLKKNFGQTAAMAAGVDQSRGDIILMMDADGQNDPMDIPKLLGKMNEGYDVVSGWRKDRKDFFLTRILPSKIANMIISYATGLHLHDYGCTLKAYRKKILTPLKLYGEMHRFIPAWCAWQGGKVAELPVQHHPRTRGKSKYGMIRTFKVVIDLLTLKFFSSYLSKPNYLFSGTGFICFLLSLVAGTLAIYDKVGPDRFPNLRIPLLLVCSGLGIVSVFFVLMGLIAELLVRLYFQNSDQKPYRLSDE